MSPRASYKKHLGAVVEIIWADAYSHDPWASPLELDGEPLECRTYGILTVVNDKTIGVSASVNGYGNIGGTWFIPLPMVMNLNVLQERLKDEGPSF